MGYEEVRVVAKAVGAARRIHDQPFDHTLGLQADFPAIGQDQYAAEACGALFVCNAAQFGDEVGVVGGVVARQAGLIG